MNAELYVADQQQLLDNRLEQDGLGIVYNAMTLDDVPMAFGTLMMMWFIGSVVCVFECLTFGWRWRDMLQLRQLRWLLPVFTWFTALENRRRNVD